MASIDDIDPQERRIARLQAENAALRHGDELCREALKRFQTDCSTPAFVMLRSAVERIEQLEGALRKICREAAHCGTAYPALAEQIVLAGALLTEPED